jgi:hypothetical protein
MAVTAAAFSAGRDVVDCLEQEANDGGRCGHEWGVVDGVRSEGGIHALGHESLGFGGDHAVVLGEEVPAGLVLPERSRDRGGDACDGDRALR